MNLTIPYTETHYLLQIYEMSAGKTDFVKNLERECERHDDL